MTDRLDRRLALACLILCALPATLRFLDRDFTHGAEPLAMTMAGALLRVAVLVLLGQTSSSGDAAD